AGLGFAALANGAASQQMRVTWRLAAWVVSATTLAAHFRLEYVQPGGSPRSSALHVALAVALGAFGLAVAAGVHARGSNQDPHLLALGLWPVITALPAYV